MKLHCFCPDLTEEQFDNMDLTEIDLSGRSFYISKMPMVSHFPMNPEIKIQKTLKEIEEKGYRTVSPLFVLFEDGLLMGNIMIEIVKPPAKDSNIKTFNKLRLISKAYKGPKHLVPKALKQFDGYLILKQIITADFFFWYHSCKVCEKQKGGRTIILAKI
ncbi:hydrolase [Phosphitispora sp. TUW77]|uniref:hydrolase n=1 Tax=Phosphitispora sp. TUW77 TaxID=3152361 RepID=UPI003AB41F5A